MPSPFTIASAVVAPLFAKNEDRGYFRTALLTTPAIFAVSAFAPNLIPSMRGAASTAIDVKNLIKKETNIVNQRVSASLVQPRRVRNMEIETSILDKYLKNSFVKTQQLIDDAAGGNKKAIARLKRIEQFQESNKELLSNAMHSARRSTLSPTEWNTESQDLMKYGAMSGKLPSLDNNQILSMYSEYKGRPEFTRTLRQRLRVIHPRNPRRITYRGTIASSQGVSDIPNVGTSTMDFDENFGLDDTQAAFRRQSPTTYENLKQARQRGLILDPEITSQLSKNVTTGDTGKILSVKITRRGNLKGFTIPIVDYDTGQVRLGKQFEQIGVGNYVLGPDAAPHKLDEWVSKMLLEHSNIPTETLEQDIAAHAYWMAADPQDSRRVSELASFGAGGESTLSPLQIRLRSLSASMTKAPLFTDKEGNLVPFDSLTQKEKMPVLEQLANSNRLIAMGSEAGVYEGRYQLREAAFLSPLSAPDSAKQDWLWRTLTKEFKLSSPNGLPNEARLGWKNQSWEQLPGEVPLAKANIHMLDPQDRSLFAELPTTLSDLHFQREETVKKFMDKGMSGTDAAAMYNDVYKMYEEGDQGILQSLGRMGESVTLMDKDFANNFRVEGISKYNMNDYSGKVGDKVSPSEAMGFMGSEAVLPKHPGEVVGIGNDAEGAVISVRHALSMHGAKTDLSVKGMNLTERLGPLKELVNSYYKRTGSGNIIPDDVNMLGTSEYLGDKLDPVQTYLGLGRDLTERLQKASSQYPEAGIIANEYLSNMESVGISFQDNQLVLERSKSLTNSAMAKRIDNLVSVSENYFAKAGEAIRNAGGYEDPVLSAFVHQGKDYGNWMMKNRLEISFGAWDHSLFNTPKQVGIGHDFETFMTAGGNLKGLEAVRSRLRTQTGGSVEQSIDFMKYLMKGNFNEEMGITIPLKDAFTSEKGSLDNATNRAKTIFDPSVEKYKKNFRVDLGNGNYLPVPGSEAYGAESSMYAPATYETKDWQKTLRDLAYAPADKQAELQAKLIGQYKSEFGIGKGSSIRPYQYDPYSVPGVAAVTSEQGDPFVARVGEEFINKIHSASQRETLLKGDTVLGIFQRQPTSGLEYLKYKYDPSFNGTMDVGVSERFLRTKYGDVDKDLVNNIFIDAHIQMENGKMRIISAGNAAERAAAEEGIAAIEGGKQARNLEIWEEMMGVQEVANQVTSFTPKTLTARAGKFAQAVEDRASKAISRTAGGTIGEYSNILTTMMEHMIQSSGAYDADSMTRLRIGLFEGIKQTPISARKVGGFSLDAAVQIADQLRKGIAMNNSDAAVEHIQGRMKMISDITESNVTGYWNSEQATSDLKIWAVNRTERARLAAAALRVGSNKSARQGAANSFLSRIYEEGLEETMGVAHTGRASISSASKLGEVASYLGNKGRAASESATGKIGKIFAEHGVGLALGIGSLAALGIALTPNKTPVASFSRASGNKFRPEERMGVSDSIPGEPVPGQMAPSMPPRRIEAASPNVRTAMVSPMNSTSDLSIRMKATDQSRAAETARQAAQIPGSGHSNVTVNYRDHTRIGSLRTREKIREIMS